MQFQSKKSFHYFTINSFLPYLMLGYYISIPCAAEPTWYKIQMYKNKWKIETYWMHLAFALGCLLSICIDLKGPYRQVMIKCNSCLIVVLIIQWFLPFREGSLIVRFFCGLLISLDIRYSNMYYRMIIKPIEIFIKRKFPNDDNYQLYGYKQYTKQYALFGIGWALQGLMSFSYPSIEMLQKLKFYDDPVLWNLLISMPCVIISIRLINLHLTFNYDELKTSTHNQGEYFLANMIKKKFVEDALEMHEQKLLHKDEERYEIGKFKSLYLLQILCNCSGNVFIVLYSHYIDFGYKLSTIQILFGLTISISVLYASNTLQYKISLPSLYRLGSLMAFISQLALCISILIENKLFCLLSTLLVLISNSIGLYTFTNANNYFIDDFMLTILFSSITLMCSIIFGQWLLRSLIGSLFVQLFIGLYTFRNTDIVHDDFDESED
ncbi:hypothetical protein pb186bvf_017253 [Paramecium bursaria]